MLFIGTSYHARKCSHFVMYSIMKSYDKGVILLFDQYLLAKQQTDINFI